MNVISLPTRVLLALSFLKGVGPAALKRIAALPDFWELSFDDWCSVVPQVAKSADGRPSGMVWQDARNWADEQIVAAEKHCARIISPTDDEYPELLAATKDDPFLLFVKGRFADSPRNSVAIIGTREPTQHGQVITSRITQFFVEQRWSVVSGLALGCDALAHQTAIAAGGHTVAVLAHGLQTISPSRHKQLAQDILDAGGALVSEYPFGKNVLGAQFVKRDRTQAGMSQGVVMIQSDIKGGSLHASRAALDYQRWLAVPYPTDKDRENGEPRIQANLLIADGLDAPRADLLRCPVSSLRLVRVVRGREDYLRLIASNEAVALAASESGLLVPREELASPMEMQQRMSESQGSMLIPETTILQVPPVVNVQNAGKASGREVRLDELEERPDVAREIALHTSILQEGTRYCLEVSTEDLPNLEIDPDLTEALSAARDGHLHEYGVDITNALWRLDYLQIRLEELRKTLASKRALAGQRASRFQFQIEDVLTHMKRAVDELGRVGQAGHSEVFQSILIHPNTTFGQVELPLGGGLTEELHDAPLVEVLDRLVDGLPWSVSIYRKNTTDECPARSGIKVHLGDVVLSFNEVIKAVSHRPLQLV